MRLLNFALFGKELRVAARRKRTYILRGLFLFSILVLLGIFWVGLSGRSRYMTAQQMSRIGREIFFFVTMAELIAILILIPPMAAAQISSEKGRDTFELLFLSNLTNLDIVLGKILATMTQLLLLFLGGLPFASLGLLYGGIELTDVGVSVAILVTTAFMGCGLGLLISTFFRRSDVAMVCALLFLFAYLAGLPLLHAAERDIGLAVGLVLLSIPVLFALAWMQRWITLSLAVLSVVVLGGFALGATGGFDDTFAGYAHPVVTLGALGFSSGSDLLYRLAATSGANLLLGTIAVALAAGSLRQSTHWNASNLLKIVFGWMDRQFWSRWWNRFFGQPNRGVRGNPLLWKESKASGLGKGRHLFRLAYLAFIPLLVSYFFYADDAVKDDDAQAFYYFLMLLLVHFLFLVRASVTFSAERERETFNLLLTTPLSANQILVGKLLGVFRTLLPFLCLPLLHSVIFVFAGGFHPYAPLLLVYHLAAYGLFYTLLGMRLSLRFKTTVRSGFATVIAFFALNVGPWLLEAIVQILDIGGRQPVIGMLSPLAHGVLSAVTPHTDAWKPEKMAWAHIYPIFYLAGAAFFIVMMKTRFHKLTGRLEEK